MYRRVGANLEVLLVHPGGPYWRKKDEGAWSIPKGEMDEGEDAEVAARREFMEETGIALSGLLDPLGDIRQRGGKRVIAFAVEGDVDVQTMKVTLSKSSGRRRVVGCRVFPRSIAPNGSTCHRPMQRFSRAQRALLDRLAELVNQLERGRRYD